MSDVEPQDKWKIEVNDRYQKVVSTIITLSTAALVLPVLFLRQFLAIPGDQQLLGSLDCRVYLSWVFLAASVVGGILFYYLSAKWVKMAWRQHVAISPGRLEFLLDCSFGFAAITFILGIVCFLWFITSFRHSS